MGGGHDLVDEAANVKVVEILRDFVDVQVRDEVGEQLARVLNVIVLYGCSVFV